MAFFKGHKCFVSRTTCRAFLEDVMSHCCFRVRDELMQNLMFGTPDQVIPKLRQYEALGVDQFTYCASFGLSMSAQKKSLALFIDEVMPEFDQASSSTLDQQTAS